VKYLQGEQPCPCGRLDATGTALAYAQCCSRCLESCLSAADAEALMRSRYTAFVLEREPYLLSTWHASRRPDGIDFDPDAKWLGLEVRASSEQDAEHAEVEFVARHRVAGRAVRLHERSRFIKEAGHWYYLDGMT
jgi:SEC-C motif-containing protein